MSDVTFAVFRSVEDLLEQMDDENKVILCNGVLPMLYFAGVTKRV